MTITLYLYKGEPNRLNKTNQLVEVAELTGELKRGTSIFSPTFLISLQPETQEGDIQSFNYMYVDNFKRFYFVSDIVASSGDLLEVSGEVDPLQSFREEIADQEGFVIRSTSDYNKKIIDSEIPLKPTKTEEIQQFTGNTFQFITDFSAQELINDRANIALSVASYTGVGAYRSGLPQSILPTIETMSFGDLPSMATFGITPSAFSAIARKLMGDLSAYGSFFKSAVAFPFTIARIGDGSTATAINILIPQDDPQEPYREIDTGQTGFLMASKSPYLYCGYVDIPELTDFRELPPYGSAEVYIPFLGFHDIDLTRYQGHRIALYYVVDYADGAADCYLYDMTKEEIAFSSPVQLGVPLSLTSTNEQEMRTQKNALSNNLILSLVGSGLTMLGSAAAHNPLGVAGGALSAVNALTSFNNARAAMFERVTSSHAGGATGLYSPLTPYIRYFKASAYDNFHEEEHIVLRGKPFMDYARVGDLQGFAILTHCHLDNLSATDREKEEIASSLASGIII